MLIRQITVADIANWLELRKQLWPTTVELEHNQQMQQILNDSNKLVAFMAYSENIPVAFTEASLRYDYVAGCNTSPVAFVEGIYVAPQQRRQGIAKQLFAKVEQWGKGQGCSELASDVELANLLSQQVHQALGFQEVERVICYYKKMQ